MVRSRNVSLIQNAHSRSRVTLAFVADLETLSDKRPTRVFEINARAFLGTTIYQERPFGLEQVDVVDDNPEGSLRMRDITSGSQHSELKLVEEGDRRDKGGK